jgi:hypothetical protein
VIPELYTKRYPDQYGVSLKVNGPKKEKLKNYPGNGSPVKNYILPKPLRS